MREKGIKKESQDGGKKKEEPRENGDWTGAGIGEGITLKKETGVGCKKRQMSEEEKGQKMEGKKVFSTKLAGKNWRNGGKKSS